MNAWNEKKLRSGEKEKPTAVCIKVTADKEAEWQTLTKENPYCRASKLNWSQDEALCLT